MSNESISEKRKKRNSRLGEDVEEDEVQGLKKSSQNEGKRRGSNEEKRKSSLENKNKERRGSAEKERRGSVEKERRGSGEKSRRSNEKRKESLESERKGSVERERKGSNERKRSLEKERKSSKDEEPAKTKRISFDEQNIRPIIPVNIKNDEDTQAEGWLSNEERQKLKRDEKHWKRTWKKAGIAVQIILFCCNAVVYVFSVLAIFGGFVIGLSSKTIELDLNRLDYFVTTPATIFLFYGIPISIVAMSGCFTTTSGNKWMCLFYIFSICILFFLDNVVGVHVFFSINSLPDFIQHLKVTMEGFDLDDPKYVGIIPLHPATYWTHLQTRGQCCGLNSWKDWENTSIGRPPKFALPDSCCNEQYSHRFCGSLILKHPDKEHHTIEDLIHMKPCLKIFPDRLINSFTEQSIWGVFIGACLIFCFLLAIVFFVMLITKKYKPGPEAVDEVFPLKEEMRQSRDTRASRRVGFTDEPNIIPDGNDKITSFSKGPNGKFMIMRSRSESDLRK